jgi:hypothetical protein
MELGDLEQAFGPSEKLVYENETGLKVFEILTVRRANVVAAIQPGHHYRAQWVEASGVDKVASVDFQDGPIPANGVNGLTSEALLAVLIHRTKTLNDRFPCEENERALYHMKSALSWFNERTAKRKARGVEGQLKA